VLTNPNNEKKAQRHLSKFRKLGLTLTQGDGPSLKYVFTKKQYLDINPDNFSR
jgi:hypothetical protein